MVGVPEFRVRIDQLSIKTGENSLGRCSDQLRIIGPHA